MSRLSKKEKNHILTKLAILYRNQARDDVISKDSILEISNIVEPESGALLMLDLASEMEEIDGK